MKNVSTMTLGNGVSIPSVGFGTFQIPEGKEVIDSVLAALEAGYRHIDTAAIYQNETGVGQALKKSGLKREEVFVTSKVWNPQQKGTASLTAFDQSLERLGLDYLDLYLIHWPTVHSSDAWRSLNKLYDEGRVRAIGVSNFTVAHLQDLIPAGTLTPMINQVELHPLFAQADLHRYCCEREIVLEAWSPLMRGRIGEFAVLKELAQKYGRSEAQVVLRWDVQKGLVTLPKSVHPERIRSNLQIFDFELTAEDMAQIDGLNREERLFLSPDQVYRDSVGSGS